MKYTHEVPGKFIAELYYDGVVIKSRVDFIVDEPEPDFNHCECVGVPGLAGGVNELGEIVFGIQTLAMQYLFMFDALGYSHQGL